MKADDSTPLEINPADIRAVRSCGVTRHALNGTQVCRTELLVGDQWQRVATPHNEVLEAIARAVGPTPLA